MTDDTPTPTTDPTSTAVGDHETSTPAPRRNLVRSGDIAPTLTEEGVRRFTVAQAVDAAQEAEVAALDSIRASDLPAAVIDAQVEAILAGAAPDDAARMRAVLKGTTKTAKPGRTSDALADDWRRGGYPYRYKMLRRDYEAQKFVLQTELLKLQAWVKDSRQRVIILFEGRDAAGKGGAIKRFMEHMNPRGARVVALEKPSEVERGQWYFQR